jgi:hypothetical protein
MVRGRQELKQRSFYPLIAQIFADLFLAALIRVNLQNLRIFGL